MSFDLDRVGEWTAVKLQIIREYAKAYSTIIAKHPLKHIYIDAFSGAGYHKAKETDEIIEGSPIIALNTEPPFYEYHFIDINKDKTDFLKKAAGARENVYFYQEDCNLVLASKILPCIKYSEFKRGLCLLDPYGLHLDWNVIEVAGKMNTIEIFLNFPVMDMQMNILWNNPDKTPRPDQISRMNRFWGDESWRDAAYEMEDTLFGPAPIKAGINKLVDAFSVRLKEKAGFKYVPKPVPMKAKGNKLLYFLFFASHNNAGNKIARHLFNKYRQSM
jgi:three-Cys-motif partner protein